MPPSETDWAWLAGIFEGEGCIEFHHKNSTAITISMTDEDVVRRAAEIAGVGSVMELTARRGHKVCWRWRVQQADLVQAVIDQIEPYLGKRRWARVQEARIRLGQVRQPGKCKNGHEMNGDNLYVAPKSGHTACRKCQIKRCQEYRERTKEKS
jgi:hypothetical protein